MSLDAAVAEVLASRRLGSLDASRHRFTVSREAALLQLRAQAAERSGGLGWTAALLRAANALSELAELRVQRSAVAAEAGGIAAEATVFEVLVPGAGLSELDPGRVLAGALEPDLGEPLAGGDAELRRQRFVMLLGRAINGALASGPLAVELQTPAGGRRYERRESISEGRDPYAERRIAGCGGSQQFVVRIIAERPGFAARFARWLRGRPGVEEELAEQWAGRLLSERDAGDARARLGEDRALSLGPRLVREPVMLGELALYGPSRDLDQAIPRVRASVVLVRDGLVLLDLGSALRERELDPGRLAGWIDCPSLRLTADERSVVQDGSFDLLVAWLHDVANRGLSGSWPQSDEDPCFVSGRPLTREALAAYARGDRECLYVWRHEAVSVPGHLRSRVLALWPAQHAELRAAQPELRLVPLRALGGQRDFDPADLSSLRAGSFAPLVLARRSPVELPGDEGRRLHASVEAYVHRAASATMGFIEILAFERRVASLREHARAIPGVTLLARVSADEAGELDVAGLRRDPAAIAAIADLCRSRTLAHWEALLSHVMSAASPFETPLLRTSLERLDARALALRYVATEAGPRLSWRDSVLLDVEVGEGPDGAPRTLRDALRQLRARGVLVLAHAVKRYPSLRSSDPSLEPWQVPSWTRPLLTRVLGAHALLEMPAVPESYPLVREDPLNEQLHLLRRRGDLEVDLSRSPADPRARARLLGQLLVARARGQDTFGLERVPLLERYDPRALRPTRLLSLTALLREQPPLGFVPRGATHRGLPAPVLEVDPGVAQLLAVSVGLRPASDVPSRALAVAVAGPDRGERGPGPVRRRVRELPPLLARSVVHRYAVGRLQVAGDGVSEHIALWAEGLRVGELVLAEPLGRVSGRLLLTPEGRRAAKAKLEAEVTTLARELVVDALRQRALLPPNGPQRARLEHFIDYARKIAAASDRFELAAGLGLREPADPGRRAAALRRMSLEAAPLRPLPASREALLTDVVAQSLGVPLHFERGWLSWRVAKLGARRPDGAYAIELGLRNRWIRQALDPDSELEPDAQRAAALLAAVLVLAEVFTQAGTREDLDVRPEHLSVALWRLLRLGLG